MESYGCQMNLADSEVVVAILQEHAFTITQDHEQANLILINTCDIRDKAEQTIRNRLSQFNQIKKKK